MKTNFDYNGINCLYIASGDNKDNFKKSQNSLLSETYTIYYVTGGRGLVTVNGIGFFVSEGQSFISFPFSQLRLEQEGEDEFEYKWVEFRGLDAAWLVSRTSLSKKKPVVGKMPVENFGRFFEFGKNDSKAVYAQCRSGGRLITLLSYYLEYFPCKNTEIVNYAISARNYIEKNYRNPEFSVRMVANHIKIDRTYLYRLFKEETGISIIDYINNFRISKAEALLVNEDISIKDVAYSVGFADQMYFSKVFKKIKGQTPTEFRRENKRKYIP